MPSLEQRLLGICPEPFGAGPAMPTCARIWVELNEAPMEGERGRKKEAGEGKSRGGDLGAASGQPYPSLRLCLEYGKAVYQTLVGEKG